MYKKLITLLCICVSAFFVQSMASAADDYDTYYSDTLEALGIHVDFDAKDSITKGEFCGIVAELMRLDTDYTGQTLYFRDVSTAHRYYKEITVCAEQGYAIGDDKGRFYPDELLTPETASAILLRCLGYELNVQYAGGWSVGYSSVAASVGLDDGVGAIAETGYTPEQINRMLFNALLAPTFEMNLSDRTLEEGETLAYKLYSAVELEGIVEQTKFTGIRTPDQCPDGIVVLDGQNVYTGETNADSYLGYRIRAMAIEDDDNAYTLISITKHAKNTDLRISYNEIGAVPDIYSIEYEPMDSNRTRTLKLERNASVIYNYQKLASYDEEDLKLDNGYIELIDNDSDGEYDIVLVYEYLTYFVTGVDTSAKVIYDKYGYEALEAEEDTIILNSHSYEVDISTIQTDSVLSVFQPQDPNAGSYTVIVVSDYAPIEGKVTGVVNDEEMTVTINGTQYAVDPRYISVSETNDLAMEIKAGLNGIFYLNKDSMISGFTYLSGDELYGYLKKLYVDELTQNAYFEVFSQEGVFVSGQVAEKLKLNDGYLRGQEDLLADGLLFPEGTFRPQLVKFKLDSEGRLSGLKAVSEEVPTNPVQTKEDQLTYNGTVTDGDIRAHKYAYKYLYTDDTVVFNVPSLEEIGNRDKYSISDKKFTDGTRMTWKLYDISFDNIIGAAVAEAGKNTVNMESQQELTVITNKYEMYDEESEEVVTAVTGILSGAEKTYTCSLEDGFFDDLQVGDMARIVTDSVTGETRAAQLIFTFRDAGATADTDAVIYHDKYARKQPHVSNPIVTGDYDMGLTQIYGRCIAKGPNTIALTLDGGNSVYASYIENNAGYYLVEYKNGKVNVTKVTADALVPSAGPTGTTGNSVMISNRNMTTREVFIIKEDM